MDERAGELACRLLLRRLDGLRPHPSYIKHGLSVSPSTLAALAESAEPFQFPIIVTRTGIIIDGYARWELARQQCRGTIVCLEYDLSNEDALRWLIESHQPTKGLNGFCRSLLALELEPSLQERARSNQRTGGQKKGSSNLTEAQKVDVRSELAAIANVSTGSLTKAKQVATQADPTVQRAAKSGEIRVHKACQWSRLSHQHQLKTLEEFRSCKGVGRVSRTLIQKHVARMTPTRLIPQTLSDVVKTLTPDRMAVLNSVLVAEIDALGQIAYFTKNAIGVLKLGEDLNARPQSAKANSGSNEGHLGPT